MDQDALVAELIADEGLRLRPYRDALGILTIGVGRNLEARGVSRDEALSMLTHDVEAVLADLDAKVSWWRRLDEDRQRVLVNMAFNLGIVRLLGFKNFLRFAEAGLYIAAAREMLDSAWARQVGPRAKRLADAMRGPPAPEAT